MLLTGCGSYSDSTRRSRLALLSGRGQEAVNHLNTRLETSAGEAEEVLLHLERGLALQQIGNYQDAVKDLMFADEKLEVMEYTSATLKELGTYLYSDDSAPYKAPPAEKALVNVLNLLNFIACDCTI